MKIIEQNSNQLILKTSTIGVWMIRLVSTPFLILGGIGIFIIITEKVFPSFFIIFCLIFGTLGVFFSSEQTVCFNKSQNQFQIQTKRLLGTKTREYPLNDIHVRVQKTPFQVKSQTSILRTQKEPIYLVILEIGSNSEKIKVSDNYSFTRDQAVEMADLIRIFLNTPP
ncbi:hypothetical protein NO108_02825 [Planktothrix rubescens]|nr:hypothetical protein NO108_02825 [Planktothrix rubescens]